MPYTNGLWGANLQIFSTKYYDLSILFLLFCQGKRGAGGCLSVGSCDQVTPLRVTSGKDVFSGWKITGSVGTGLFPLPFHFFQRRTGSCSLGIAGKRKVAWGPGSLCVAHGKNTPDYEVSDAGVLTLRQVPSYPFPVKGQRDSQAVSVNPLYLYFTSTSSPGKVLVLLFPICMKSLLL